MQTPLYVTAGLEYLKGKTIQTIAKELKEDPYIISRCIRGILLKESRGDGLESEEYVSQSILRDWEEGIADEIIINTYKLKNKARLYIRLKSATKYYLNLKPA